ncbi:MAG: SocA family protein [Methanobrevibacter sp.]|jgi:uncharacterized phage-associated protein|nr:SocA family protein [Methanobrevibacter sp.]
MNLNTEKMKTIIHYIIKKTENKKNCGKTVLYKLLYFSDFNHYELYEKLITNETYLKFPKGPVPKHMNDLLDELIIEKKIIKKENLVGKHIQQQFLSSSEPNTSKISSNELTIINNVINDLGDMNATKISDYSHGDKPWRVAKSFEELEPEYVFYRDHPYSLREYEDD